MSLFAISSLGLLAVVSENGFQSFTPAHFWTVVVCGVFMTAMVWRGRWLQKHCGAASELRWRRAYGWLCVAVSVFSFVWYLLPQNFDWEISLPLQFCDTGILVAAGVLLTQAAWLRGLLYFWTFVFTLNAFVTPIVHAPMLSVEFVLFWTAHSVIVGPELYDLVVGKFKLTWRDVVRSYVISFMYSVAMFALDRVTGWNYAFLGPSKPSAPTILDALGPYPARVGWMTLIATIGFGLAWLPWAWRRKRA